MRLPPQYSLNSTEGFINLLRPGYNMHYKRSLVTITTLLMSFLGSTAIAQSFTPPGTVAHRDIPYVTDGHELQALDIFVPEKAEGPFPLVIWVHGGGWHKGDKKNNRLLRSGLLQRDYAIASINYRLSQHAVFPAQIQDCKAAIRWLRAHADKYNIDASRIGVAGASAGGHLVTLLGTSGGHEAFDVGEHLDQSSDVQAVCDFFGPTDLAKKSAHNKQLNPKSPESKLIGGAVGDPANYEKAKAANPMTYITEDDAPFLIMHGDADPAVPYNQSELLFDALTETGIPVHFITVLGGEHGGGFPEKKLFPQMVDFFDRHIKGDESAAQWGKVKTSSVKAISKQ